MKSGKKVGVFVAMGFISALLGLLLLYVFVEWFGLNKNIANLTQLLITLQVNFALNMRYTWKSKPKTLKEFAGKWLGFHLVRATGSLVNLGGYAILIIWLPYGIAYGIMMGVVAVLNYLGMDKFVFKEG